MKVLKTDPNRTVTAKRPAEKRPMRFTDRDSRILETIHAFDGVMGDYQIKRRFFTGDRQCRGRLSVLFQHGFLARPDRKKRVSLPCMVYWLDKQGAAYVAGLNGQEIREFSYRREPRWSQIIHDLAVNDFRLDVLEACKRHPKLSLEQWIPESEFWAYPDKVQFTDRNGKKSSRNMRPDGFFVVRQGDYYSRLLLELDRATEDNPRFAREKVLPGIAYLRSKAYKQRFGFQSGRWLVVTTSERRMRNLKRQTEAVAGKDARVFYFTTADQVQMKTLLTEPIWYRGGDNQPSALFSTADSKSFNTRIPFAMLT